MQTFFYIIYIFFLMGVVMAFIYWSATFFSLGDIMYGSLFFVGLFGALWQLRKEFKDLKKMLHEND